MAHIKARDLRRRIQEEQKNGLRIRCTEDVLTSDAMREFTEKGLALDEDGHRLHGKRPQFDFARDISLREMAEELVVNKSDGKPVGPSFVEQYFRSNEDMMRLRESGEIDAVDWTMFRGITGQILVNAVLERAESEEYIFTRMAGNYPTKLISGERIPGVSPPKRPDQGQPGSDVLLKKPGESFKYFGFGSEWIDLPSTDSRGGIIPIDRWSIYADRTGLIADQAGQVGDIIAYDKECRGWDTLIGLNGYKFKEKRMDDSDVVSIDPYQASSATWGTASPTAGQLVNTTPGLWGSGSLSQRPYAFVNDIANNPLGASYQCVQTCDIAFSQTHDPSTGRPIKVGKPFIIATKSREMDIAPVLQAMSIWKMANGGLNSTGGINTIAPNPLQQLGMGADAYRVSRQLRDQLVAAGCTGTGGKPDPDKVWFYGDIPAAIQYAENSPIRVVMAPSNSEAEFMQDIVLRARADERGAWIWRNPRVLQRVNYRTQG